MASVPGSPARELSRLVQLQRDKLQALESRLLGCEAEMQDWEGSAGEVNEVSENLIKNKWFPVCILFPKTSSVYTLLFPLHQNERVFAKMLLFLHPH